MLSYCLCYGMNWWSGRSNRLRPRRKERDRERRRAADLDLCLTDCCGLTVMLFSLSLFFFVFVFVFVFFPLLVPAMIRASSFCASAAPLPRLNSAWDPWWQNRCRWFDSLYRPLCIGIASPDQWPFFKSWLSPSPRLLLRLNPLFLSLHSQEVTGQLDTLFYLFFIY